MINYFLGIFSNKNSIKLEIIKWLNIALALRDVQNAIEDEIEKGILPDPSQIDPITGQPLPQEGGEMGEVPQDPDLEAQGEVTDAQAQKDARKAEI